MALLALRIPCDLLTTLMVSPLFLEMILPLVLPSLCFARSETDHVGEVSGSPRKRLLLGNCCESVISSSPKSRALPDIVRLSAAKGELDGLGLFFCAARAASFARISRICFVKIAPSKAVIERSLSNE